MAALKSGCSFTRAVILPSNSSSVNGAWGPSISVHEISRRDARSAGRAGAAAPVQRPAGPRTRALPSRRQLSDFGLWDSLLWGRVPPRGRHETGRGGQRPGVLESLHEDEACPRRLPRLKVLDRDFRVACPGWYLYTPKGRSRPSRQDARTMFGATSTNINAPRTKRSMRPIGLLLMAATVTDALSDIVQLRSKVSDNRQHQRGRPALDTAVGDAASARRVPAQVPPPDTAPLMVEAEEVSRARPGTSGSTARRHGT